MLLRDLVETSGVVAATRSRKAKVAAIAERLAQAEVDELPGRHGVPRRHDPPAPHRRRLARAQRAARAGRPSRPLTVLEVHETLDRLAAMSGPGSQEARASGVRDLFAPGDRRRAALAARAC